MTKSKKSKKKLFVEKRNQSHIKRIDIIAETPKNNVNKKNHYFQDGNKSSKDVILKEHIQRSDGCVFASKKHYVSLILIL